MKPPSSRRCLLCFASFFLRAGLSCHRRTLGSPSSSSSDVIASSSWCGAIRCLRRAMLSRPSAASLALEATCHFRAMCFPTCEMSVPRPMRTSSFQSPSFRMFSRSLASRSSRSFHSFSYSPRHICRCLAWRS